jgi:sodium-dependent dicarboxylate transporter 2/3/5
LRAQKLKVDFKLAAKGTRKIRRVVTMRWRVLFLRLWEKRWFLIAMLIGTGMLYLPLPNGLTEQGMIMLTMSVVATILFITEPIPLPGVALLIIIAQVVLMGMDSSAVAKSMWNDSVLFIMGSLMLAVAVVKQKLDKRIAFLIVRNIRWLQ